MSDIHIDDFYKDAAKVLLQLYAIFPRRSAIYVEDISGPAQPDEYGVPDDRFHACFSTMVWLGEHDYLQYVDTIRQEAIDQATLTQKGFMLLSSRGDSPVTASEENANEPASMAHKTQSNIHLLRSAVKSRSSSEINRVMRDILSRSDNL